MRILMFATVLAMMPGAAEAQRYYARQHLVGVAASSASYDGEWYPGDEQTGSCNEATNSITSTFPYVCKVGSGYSYTQVDDARCSPADKPTEPYTRVKGCFSCRGSMQGIGKTYYDYTSLKGNLANMSSTNMPLSQFNEGTMRKACESYTNSPEQLMLHSYRGCYATVSGSSVTISMVNNQVPLPTRTGSTAKYYTMDCSK